MGEKTQVNSENNILCFAPFFEHTRTTHTDSSRLLYPCPSQQYMCQVARPRPVHENPLRTEASHVRRVSRASPGCITKDASQTPISPKPLLMPYQTAWWTRGMPVPDEPCHRHRSPFQQTGQDFDAQPEKWPLRPAVKWVPQSTSFAALRLGSIKAPWLRSEGLAKAFFGFEASSAAPTRLLTNKFDINRSFA